MCLGLLAAGAQAPACGFSCHSHLVVVSFIKKKIEMQKITQLTAS